LRERGAGVRGLHTRSESAEKNGEAVVLLYVLCVSAVQEFRSFVKRTPSETLGALLGLR